jgi:ribosomal protein L23
MKTPLLVVLKSGDIFEIKVKGLNIMNMKKKRLKT